MENYNNEPNNTPHTDQSVKRSSKSTLYGIIALLLIVGTIFGFREYQSNKNPDERLTLNDITKLKDEERIKALEDRVKELADQAKQLKDDAESGAKYTAYIQLAEAQLELDKFPEAMESLNKIPEDQKNNSRVASAYVRAYYGIGDAPKAKNLSSVNILQYPEEPSVWLAHFEVNPDLPKEELNSLYRQAIPATKSNIDIMISYARFCERIGDKATAIAAWETAVNVDSGNAAKYQAEIDRLKQ